MSVNFRIDPKVNLNVPTDMHGEIEDRVHGRRIVGRAEYSNYRQFRVDVIEQVRP